MLIPILGNIPVIPFETCFINLLSFKDTAFVAKVSKNLVYEYLNLIQENQIDIENKICDKNGKVNFDKNPFRTCTLILGYRGKVEDG